MEKDEILAKFLKLDDTSEIIPERDNIYGNKDSLFSYGTEDYAVLTDDEADKAFYDLETELFDEMNFDAFNESWLKDSVSIYIDNDELRQATDGEYDDVTLFLNNYGYEELYNLIKDDEKLFDKDDFFEDVKISDGRGILATYDGQENEITVDGETYYIYNI